MRLTFLKAKAQTIAFALSAILLIAGSAFSQTGTTSISGTVADQAGGVLPGATVTVTNPDTGFNRSMVSTSTGRFSFVALPPATYRVEVERSGFRKLVNNSVVALVDSPVALQIALEAGDVSAVVEVTTGTIESIVNTQDASVGNNFVAQQITELPSGLGRVENLLTLQPGVTPGGAVSGARANQTNYTLDGVDINDAQGGALSDGIAIRLSAAALEEFRITTTNANANQGRSSGAQGSLITKQGTNDFRGSIFYTRRPTAFSANTFHNNRAGIERPKLDRDIYGGTLGGPIWKNRAFFFYSYEGQNDQKELAVNRLVPRASLGSGQVRFSGTGPTCTGGVCTLTPTQINAIIPSGTSPAAIAYLASVASRYPVNNSDLGDGFNTGGFRFNTPTSTKENSHVGRFDLNLSNSQTISARANYQWDNLAQGTFFPDTAARAFWNHPTALAVSHTWTITGNKLNKISYGLTRQAFSNQGDLSGPTISFREVFVPTAGTRTSSRVSAVHSFYDDFTWIKGNHSLQFGGTYRMVRNKRSTLAGTEDSAFTNISWYTGTGNDEAAAITAAGYSIGSGINVIVHPLAAVIGGMSQYSWNYVFDKDGSVVPPGTPIQRRFATEEAEFYAMDSWKIRRDLTLTLGLRYLLSRPVYEQNGFQVTPDIPLRDFFDRRKASAYQGIETNDIVSFSLSGPANDGESLYPMDWGNWQPRIAVAWSPNFKDRYLRGLFGREGASTFRGGFSITNDNFGQQLAVNFDGFTHIGFTASATVPFGYSNNFTGPFAPKYSPGMNIRSFPGITPLTLDLGGQASGYQGIKVGIDSKVDTPIHYVWSFSYGRILPKGMHVEATYIGRKARNLFAFTDVAAWNNLRDPISGMDWYTAAGILVDARRANVPVSQVGTLPYFENLFPGLVGRFGQPTATRAAYQRIAKGAQGGANITDWTFWQQHIQFFSGRDFAFQHDQYDALHTWGTYAKSDYHGGSLTFRQRLGEGLTYDINYTFSKSMDLASSDGGLITNPLIPELDYSPSSFDARHMVNANFIVQLPFGRGKKYFGGMNRWADIVVGGWQLAGIYRFRTGYPVSGPTEYPRWATNWQYTSTAILARPLEFNVDRNTGQAFADPLYAMNSFRSSKPGEIGTKRFLRQLSVMALDTSLSKSFGMPWSENHKLKLRWDVFNVGNMQPLGIDGTLTLSRFAIPADPDLITAANLNPNFGRIFATTMMAPRSMQFGISYQF